MEEEEEEEEEEEAWYTFILSMLPCEILRILKS
jgi:hypothetical protein